MPEGAVYVGRGSPWGNPFVVGRDGPAAECVRLYGMLLGGMICVSAKAGVAEQRAVLDRARSHLDELRGRNLACWCALGTPCHADVLLRLVNAGGGR